MSNLEVTVEQYTLSVDAADTVRAVLSTTDIAPGDHLIAVLHLLTGSAAPLHVADPNELAANQGLLPAGQEPPPRVSASTADDALAELARVGAVTVHPLWTETSTEAYLSEGRRFTLLRVLRPLILIRIEHAPNLHPARHGWRITERTRTTPVGWYLLGEVGDITNRLIGAGKLDIIPEPDRDAHAIAIAIAEALTYKLVQTDGFGASRCDAGCTTCHTRWHAESGSWHFTPDTTHNAPTWDYDDADGFHDDGTITCPACRTGRVGFTIT